MSWLEKLKGIFNIEINKPLLNIDFSRTVKVEAPDKPYKLIESTEGISLQINPDNLNEQQIGGLKEVVKELPKGTRILEKKTHDLLKKLYRYQKGDEQDQKLLEFFQGAISQEDLEALDDSLVLRRAFKRKEDVSFMKDDIREKFGQRGARISDLCTSNYFEEFFIPLFNYSKEEFHRIYEQTVANRILAIFVHGYMTEDVLKQEIKDKIITSRNYGLKIVRVHAIGWKNVQSVNKFFTENKELLDSFKVISKMLVNRKDIIIIELLL